MVLNIFCSATMRVAEKPVGNIGKKLAERKKIINFIPAEDIDLQNEQIDVDYEDFDTKIALSNFQYVHQFFIPMMAIKNNNEEETHNFLKTYYMLEKVNAVDPKTNLATPVIILCDTGCGKTV